MERRSPANSPPLTWVITTQAEYQTEFWTLVARECLQRGQDVFVLSFDERSMDRLTAQTIPSVNVYAEGLRATDGLNLVEEFGKQMRSFEIDNANLLLSHERAAFRVRSTKQLKEKFALYVAGIRATLDELERNGRRFILVQELGGFLSTLSAFHEARRRKVDNIFVEPSFFRGRFFCQKNALKAVRPVLTHSSGRQVSNAVQLYLNETLEARAIVIPKKDVGSYRSAWKKILSRRNIRRLGEKLVDRYIFRKHQDFGYIGSYALIHLRMLVTSFRMRRLYRPLSEIESFIYYPLHVPADVALTLRSPEYLDQLSIVDYLLRNIPQTHILAIKEHPAQLGAVDINRLTQLLARYDNLVVLPAGTNNYDVIERAAVVVSVNSKSGAEAMLVGKPVIVLGDAFYTDAPFVIRCPSLRDLPRLVIDALKESPADPQAVAAYFQAVFDLTLAGELYVLDQDNIRLFADSLAQACPANPIGQNAACELS